MYQQKFGKLLCDNPDLFDGEDKYTLKPLKEKGPEALVCIDQEGIEEIKLLEVCCHQPEHYQNGCVTCKVNDLFEHLRSSCSDVPEGELVSAKFDVLFSGEIKPRKLTIKCPNQMKLQRKEDLHLIESWLKARGFIKQPEQEKVGELEDALAVA